MQNNLEIIKLFYRVEVKEKTKYKTYFVSNCDISQNFIFMHGIEIESELEINSLDDATNLLATKESIDIYYPWSSVISIVLKRFTKKQ